MPPTALSSFHLLHSLKDSASCLRNTDLTQSNSRLTETPYPLSITKNMLTSRSANATTSPAENASTTVPTNATATETNEPPCPCEARVKKLELDLKEMRDLNTLLKGQVDHFGMVFYAAKSDLTNSGTRVTKVEAAIEEYKDQPGRQSIIDLQGRVRVLEEALKGVQEEDALLVARRIVREASAASMRDVKKAAKTLLLDMNETGPAGKWEPEIYQWNHPHNTTVVNALAHAMYNKDSRFAEAQYKEVLKTVHHSRRSNLSRQGGSEKNRYRSRVSSRRKTKGLARKKAWKQLVDDEKETGLAEKIKSLLGAHNLEEAAFLHGCQSPEVSDEEHNIGVYTIPGRPATVTEGFELLDKYRKRKREELEMESSSGEDDAAQASSSSLSALDKGKGKAGDPPSTTAKEPKVKKPKAKHTNPHSTRYTPTAQMDKRRLLTPHPDYTMRWRNFPAAPIPSAVKIPRPNNNAPATTTTPTASAAASTSTSAMAASSTTTTPVTAADTANLSTLASVAVPSTASSSVPEQSSSFIPASSTEVPASASTASEVELPDGNEANQPASREPLTAQSESLAGPSVPSTSLQPRTRLRFIPTVPLRRRDVSGPDSVLPSSAVSAVDSAATPHSTLTPPLAGRLAALRAFRHRYPTSPSSVATAAGVIAAAERENDENQEEVQE